MKQIAFIPLTLGLAAAAVANPDIIDGVTFDDGKSKMYVPIRRVGDAFGWPVHYDNAQKTVYLNNKAVVDGLKREVDGTILVDLGELRNHGARVAWNGNDKLAEVRDDANPEKLIYARLGDKRVVIDKSKQQMIGYQGERVVFRSSVSTGRQGYATPNGTFPIKSYKARMHYSSIYDNAEMPFSVQVVDDIFVHGYESVPEVPASHGCIRLPLDGANPARWFYHWAEVGVPVTITGSWG